MMGLALILTSTLSAIAGILLGVSVAARPAGEEADVNEPQGHAATTQQRFISPEVFVYPMQSGNALSGYMVVRLVLPLAGQAGAAGNVPDEIVIADAFYASLFSMRSGDGLSDTLPSIDQLTSNFLLAANQNAGGQRYKSALVQQFDVFEPDTMRRKNVRDRMTEPDPEPQKPKPAH